MKVSRAQAAENRDRVVATAGRLFREKGFDGIGLADLMHAAGLTHGGFYRNFPSKDALAAEACDRALAAGAERWRGIIAAAGDAPLQAIVTHYLTAQHRDHPGAGCALAALGAEAARRGGPVRGAFTQGLRRLADLVTTMLPGRKAARREQALATLSGLVGALVLARAVDDEALSDEILAAARRVFGRTPSA